MGRATGALVTLVCALAGCRHAGAMLDPAGVQAARIGGLWDVFYYVSIAVWAATVAVTAWAVAKRRPVDFDPARPLLRDDYAERRSAMVVTGATVATVVTLFALVTASVVTGRDLASLGHARAVEVDVIGRQWWWEFRYRDPLPGNVVFTADEMHVPVGRPVRAYLHAADVIHSFWVPALHGKRDLVPGHDVHVELRADRAGRYPGRCAEFCGLQHATMAFEVVAEGAAAFDAWLAAQRAPAREPATDAERRGRRVFLTRSCILCHAVRGTVAGGAQAPDLTHVASRRSLAGGAIPNRRDRLAEWILHPERIKPGTRMPATPLGRAELDDLLAWLESLR